MKTKSEIKKRLNNLRIKHAKKYISNSQERCFQNCAYNRVHETTGIYPSSKSFDVTMASRKQMTLVVINNDSPVHLCMYGADDPSSWSGDICNDDSIAKSCKWFKPVVSPEQAKNEFLSSLSDDDFVFNNYKDIATLQWVLNERIFKNQLSRWESFLLWLKVLFSWKKRPLKKLPSGEIPEDLWDDNSSSSS